MWPVDKNRVRITFPYGVVYNIPAWFKKGVTHKGVDIAPLISSEDIKVSYPVNGIIEYADWQDRIHHDIGFGLYVRILFVDHAGGLLERHYLAHLKDVDAHPGESVSKGQGFALIGTKKGEIGWATGIHTHYEVRRSIGNGKWGVVSPMPYLT